MKRKYILILTGCALCMCIILVVLYASSTLSKEIYRGNFARNFAQSNPTETGVLDLTYNSYYISGITSDNIYLSNYTAPLHLLVTNITLTDSQHVKLKITSPDSIIGLRKFRTIVDSPYFFLAHGVMPKLFRGRLNHWEASRFMPDSAYFAEAVPISPSSFALRSYSLKSKAYELAKEMSKEPYFEFKYGLLEKQIDGLLCVDGILHYNKELKKLIYLYAYRNQYIVMDTNLNLINRYNTIDTFSHAKIKVASIESKNANMLAAPPIRVNGTSSVTGKHLFIRSNLMSKNEDKGEFESSLVIDVYDLAEGLYSHSFYLSKYQNKKFIDFKVSNDKLTAIFDHYLIVYDLSNTKTLTRVQGIKDNTGRSGMYAEHLNKPK